MVEEGTEFTFSHGYTKITTISTAAINLNVLKTNKKRSTTKDMKNKSQWARQEEYACDIDKTHASG